MRLSHVDDIVRVRGYRNFLSSHEPPDIQTLSSADLRLLRMLVSSITDKVIDMDTTLADACNILWTCEPVRLELLRQLDAIGPRVSREVKLLPNRAEVPLQLHARYTRIEILSAFDQCPNIKAPPWQSGAYKAQTANADLLTFTLEQKAGQFLPESFYRNYAIRRDLVHWESQTTTRSASKTGMRYQQHAQLGSEVMLFARVRADDRAFWFLGSAEYVGHKSEMPMAITWRLHFAMSQSLFVSLAATK